MAYPGLGKGDQKFIIGILIKETPVSLSDATHLTGVLIEFTTGCNLKCCYCAVSQPEYVATDLDNSTFDNLVVDLTTMGVTNVCISGHGETTSVREWHSHARRIIDTGIKVAAISNLAKVYSNEELETLARFHRLVVSIDTIDIDAFKHLRRGSDLRRVLYNISTVRACALRGGIRPPVFSLVSVVCDRTVFGLSDLVHYGLAMGILDFSFQNLFKMPEVKGAIDFRPIAEMPDEDIARVPAVFDEVERIIAAHGGTCEIQAGLREAAAAVRGDERIEKVTVGTGFVYRTDKSAGGMTRDCLDPWNQAFVSSDGTVKPCCFMSEGVGKIGADQSLKDICGGPLMREYRESILTGQLKGSCCNCKSRGWTTPERMASKVRAYNEAVSLDVGVPSPATPSPSMPNLEPENFLLRMRLLDIERSTSWRITAPLRAVMRATMAAIGRLRS